MIQTPKISKKDNEFTEHLKIIKNSYLFSIFLQNIIIHTRIFIFFRIFFICILMYFWAHHGLKISKMLLTKETHKHFCE